jgi:cbb3-type cytochrome oxidase subunit 1
MVGVVMGLVMGITRQFQYAPIHAHINLLGWVSLAVIALIYHAFPQAAQTRLARLHFRLHNIGLPIFMVSLFLFIEGQPWARFGIPIGAMMTLFAVTVFVINLIRTVGVAQPVAAPAA